MKKNLCIFLSIMFMNSFFAYAYKFNIINETDGKIVGFLNQIGGADNFFSIDAGSKATKETGGYCVRSVTIISTTGPARSQVADKKVE